MSTKRNDFSDKIKNMFKTLGSKQETTMTPTMQPMSNYENMKSLGLVKETTGELKNLYMTFGETNEGCVFEKDSDRVVCAAQRKIKDITLEELKEKLENISDSTVEYCEDGTMIRLYYYNLKWWTATSRCLDARKSFWSSSKTFDEMFWETFESSKLEDLDIAYTYNFVLLHKENRIVVHHITNKLVYVSRTNNETLVEEASEPDGWNVPLRIIGFTAANIESYFRVTKRGILVKTEKETFKVDFEQYKRVKDVRGNVPNIQVRWLELLNDPDKLDVLTRLYSEYRDEFEKLSIRLREIIREIHKLYIDSHVKHIIQVSDDNIYYQTLKQLHAQYKNTKMPIYYDDVENKVKHLSVHVLSKFIGELR